MPTKMTLKATKTNKPHMQKPGSDPQGPTPVFA
ncbi:hypothetical protein CLU93_2999 [Janthinobacterium sp. 35]|nr:hypothetical protein CLU93_2999 [Janthinobacterium sp. 35]